MGLGKRGLEHDILGNGQIRTRTNCLRPNNEQSHDENGRTHSPTRQGFDLKNHNSVELKSQDNKYLSKPKIALKRYLSNYACGIDIGGEDVSPECKKAKDDFAAADGTLEEMTLQGGFSMTNYH